MTTKKISGAAKVLSESGAAKGGRARASVLTPEQRSEQARRAVTARWAKAGKIPTPSTPPKAAGIRVGGTDPELPSSLHTGLLRLGRVRMRSHVLDDERRVLTQREVVRAITGGSSVTGSGLQRYLANLRGFDKRRHPSEPIPFRIPGNPTIALGYEATLLIDICDAYITARDMNWLRPGQDRLVVTAESIIRACAKVGIIALVDEATGYQQVRAKRALQLKLQAFINDDIQEWARMFPEEFWVELARLESTHYSPGHRPLRWGKYVMAFVYDAIDPDIGKALRRRNPNPHFKQNHHQWLKQYGRDKVGIQIGKAVGIMQMCSTLDEFKERYSRVLKTGPIQLTLADFSDAF